MPTYVLTTALTAYTKYEVDAENDEDARRKFRVARGECVVLRHATKTCSRGTVKCVVNHDLPSWDDGYGDDEEVVDVARR